MAASDRVAIDSARNKHAMKVAGSYDDGDGYISDQEWTRYQQDLGNTWNAKTGWSNNGQPSHQAAASRAAAHTSNKKLPDIDTYNRTAYGAGAEKGTDRLSGADLRRLEDYGYGLQEIVDYAEKSYAEGSKGGGAAQSVLDEFKNKLISQRSQPAHTPAPAAPPPKETGPRIVTGDKNITMGDIDLGDYGKGKGGSNIISAPTGDINIAGDSINSRNNTGTIDERMGAGGGSNILTAPTGDIGIGGDSVGSINNTGIIDKSMNVAGLGPSKDPDDFLDGELTSLTNPNEGVAAGIDSASADQDEVPGMDKQNVIAAPTGQINIAGDSLNSVNNTGVMDYSVTVTEKGPGGGLSNFGAAVAGMGLNNNMLARDHNMYGAGQALNAISLADLGGSQERIAKLDDAVNLSYLNALKKSDKYNQFLFGDPLHTRQYQPGQMYSFETKEPDYSKAEEIYNS